jgi:hypothetical protein
MDVMVLSSARKLLSRSVIGSSLAGDGLLVRLRSTSIALIGLVAAVGLGLIAFISQLGWPGVLNAPIPGSPAETGSVRDAIALTRPARGGPTTALAVAPSTPARAVRVASEPAPGRSGGGSGVGGSRQLSGKGETQPPAPESSVPPAPAAPPAPSAEPESSPVTTSPPPATTQPVASAPVSKPPATSAVSTSKEEPASSSPGKSGEDHGVGSGRPKGPSSEPAKPVKEVKPPSEPAKSTPPPVVAPPPKAPPESGGHGAGGPGKSDWHRH